MTFNKLLKTIGLHSRPTTLAALYADLESSPEAQEAGVLDAIIDALSGNIGYEEGKALIEAERSQA
jgi:hypothetical protein